MIILIHIQEKLTGNFFLKIINIFFSEVIYMMSKINIDIMTDKEKTALVCLYFAQLKSSDNKYNKTNS